MHLCGGMYLCCRAVLLWSTDYRPGPLAELAEATPLAMGPGVLMAEALSTSSCAVLPHRHGGDA